MESTKRQRNASWSQSGAGASKRRKTSTPHQQGGLRITVALRSNSKAAQHDPEHSTPFVQDLEIADVSDGSQETSSNESGDERQRSLGSMNGDPDDVSLGFNSSPDTGSVGSETDGDINSQNDEFAEWRWLEQIDVCAHVGKKKVAHCDAKLIRRDWMRYDFLTEIQEPNNKEATKLGLDLFDRYGCLRREFYEHEVKLGTGAWNNELDQGDILLIGDITVDFLYRRNGFATKIIEALLDKTRRKSEHFFAFARPRFVSKLYHTGEERERIETTIGEQFFRSLGFRRVGTSRWLAFADSGDHPSRFLHRMSDIAIFGYSTHPGVVSHEIHAIMGILLDATKTDSQCVRQIKQIIRRMDRRVVSSTDSKGNSILHIAALSRRPKVVAYIRSQFDYMTTARNMEGYTPVQALHSALDTRRTIRALPTVTKVVSDSFQGFKQSEVACLLALTGFNPDYDSTSDAAPSMDSGASSIESNTLSDVSTASDEDEDELFDKLSFGLKLLQWKNKRHDKFSRVLKGLQWRYGCTCGECIEGFLSPRMKFALGCQAELKHALLLKSNDLSGREWVRLRDDHLRYVSPDLRDQLAVNARMRDGFANICELFALCLRNEKVPNETNICNASRETPRDLELFSITQSTWEYLTNGGTVSAVATMVFEKAMSEDQWAGDGTHEEDFKPHEALPVCRNDHEFGFVSGMCGYKRVTPSFSIKMGPKMKVYGCKACENESSGSE
ncbi:hypothetical protein EDB81DRAFT_881777 [Dactylonectria macrodidyma]|uniref:Uncharacterized protein n=1 Tax=Dactylonectria macrodidyma TaxID=307937 RepID=A0A9P9JBN2_9HYPO|nr:hypothetical protein EDB81DRAFT_881777 [Dactylonectria macrodidyma]